MSEPIYRILPAAAPDESALNEGLVSLLRFIVPAFSRFVLKIDTLRLIGAERLIDAYQDFQNGKSRLMLVFRHPYGDEPQILGHALLRSLPRAAKRAGKPLKKKTHAHFIHGYEVPLWSPPAIGWLLPRAGALPVHHSKLDSRGLARLRKTMLNGPYPLALAPEGQVSYSSQSLPRLERGFAHIGLWCADDLEKAGRTEQVSFLPLSVHYSYGKKGPKALEKALKLLEAELGIEPLDKSPVLRLKEAAEKIVSLAEGFYTELKVKLIDAATKGSLQDRWAAILETALSRAERALNLSDDGDTIARVYRIRQRGWDRIYRNTEKDISPLEKKLLDREAGEAWYAMRHMETADIGWYIDFEATIENDSIDLLIERTLNYWDIISRLKGGNFSDRLNIGLKTVYLVAGNPIEIRSRPDLHGRDRKAQIEIIAKELEKEYLHCIDLYQKEHHDGKR